MRGHSIEILFEDSNKCISKSDINKGKFIMFTVQVELNGHSA